MPASADMPPPVAMVLTATVLMMLAGSIAAWQYIARRVWHGLPILASASRRPVPWSGIDLIVMLVLSLLASQLLLSVLAIFPAHFSGEQLENEIVALAELEIVDAPSQPADELEFTPAKLLRWSLLTGAAMTICLAYLAWRRRPTRADLGIPPGHLLPDVLLGVASFLAAVVPVYGLMIVLSKLFPSKHPLTQAMFSDPSWPMIISGRHLGGRRGTLGRRVLFSRVAQGWLESAERKLSLRWNSWLEFPLASCRSWPARSCLVWRTAATAPIRFPYSPSLWPWATSIIARIAIYPAWCCTPA